MSLLAILLPVAAILLLAYRIYGGILARLFRLDGNATTPAVALRDDVDYEPISPGLLLGQHFSAIAAAGPIVGPILAGVAFGWAPALAWIRSWRMQTCCIFMALGTRSCWHSHEAPDRLGCPTSSAPTEPWPPDSWRSDG